MAISEDTLNAFCDILDIDSDGITPDTPLEAISGWDSMSVVMLSYYIWEHYARRVQSSELRQCTTVQDVLSLMQ